MRHILSLVNNILSILFLKEVKKMKKLSIKKLSSYLGSIVNHNIQSSLMIWGAPGIGKSSVVSSVAKKNNLELIDLRISQLAPTDLRGIPVPANKVASWYPPEFLPKEGKGILFLDEINMAPPAVQGIAQQLILDRKIVSVKEFLQRPLLKEEWERNDYHHAKEYIASIWRGTSGLDGFSIVPIQTVISKLEDKFQETNINAFKKALSVLTDLQKEGAMYLSLDGQSRSYLSIVPYIKGNFTLNHFKERVNIYNREGFNYEIHTINLDK